VNQSMLFDASQLRITLVGVFEKCSLLFQSRRGSIYDFNKVLVQDEHERDLSAAMRHDDHPAICPGGQLKPADRPHHPNPVKGSVALRR
jgi:hypothetical protein